MNNNEIAMYALVVIAALALGYLFAGWAVPNPNTGNNVTNLSNSTIVTPNAAQVAKIKTALEGLLQVQSGQKITLSFTGASDNGQYVDLNFTDSTGRALPPVSVSRDYQYLYQGAVKVDDFIKEVNAYLAQNNTTTNQTGSTGGTVVKSDKPTVELFVMSYCPFGTQMEKALIPAEELLGAKANISIKFVGYTMHGQPEIIENTRQYCIMKNNPDKYWAYLKCFLADSSGAPACMANLSIDANATAACMNQTYANYSINPAAAEQYPRYTIFADENTRYGVQGSPTLVINGVVASVNRSPEALKEAICNAFNTPPAECSTNLSTTTATSGFGYGAGSGSSGGGCGV